jgi:hypothetical protein
MDEPHGDFSVESVTNLNGGQRGAVQAAASDPARLETLYQSARASGATQGFAAAIESAYAEEPANVLYGAWHYRLLSTAAAPAAPPADGQASDRAPRQWQVAIPLSILLGFLFWFLSSPGFTLRDGSIPAFVILAPPLAAAFLIGFLAFGERTRVVRSVIFIALLIALTVYATVISPLNGVAYANAARDYQTLAIIHLPVIAWGLVGLSLVGLRISSTSVFAFLTKSIEAIGTGGVFAIAGGMFVVVTIILFETLGITLGDPVLRLLLAGGAGLIPLIAVSAVYDASQPPERQEFRRGFGKILAVLMQALLALSLLVMLIYILVIPFSFTEPFSPFSDRTTLIAYNVVLIGVMGVLLGATPFASGDLAPSMQRLVRSGIILLAVMVAGVSVYALAAVLYRTAHDALTMNRLTIIGWNVINIAILFLLLIRQAISGRANWIASVHDTFRWGAILYLGWALFVLVASPLIF